MQNVLIVSLSEKSIKFFADILREASFSRINSATSCAEASRKMLEMNYDLVVVNGPLRDESGEGFACSVANRRESQVIFVVKSDFYDETCAKVEESGVFCVAKPMNKVIFWSSLKFVRSAHKQLLRVQSENAKLKSRIEDIKIIDRAKCLLISYMSISEEEAHRYIEKQAMDMRTSRRKIAEKVLKTYDY